MLVLSNIVRLVLQNLSVEEKELKKNDEEDECLDAEQRRLLRGNSDYWPGKKVGKGKRFS